MNLVATRLLKGCHQAALLLAIMLLASCSPRTSESQQATATQNHQETPVVLSSPPTSTSSPEANLPTSAETVLPPEDILKFQPFEITPQLPSHIKTAGTLVMWQDSLQLLHFEPQTHVEIIPGIDPESSCLTTSPDGKWLAHCHFSNESPTGQWLFVESANWQQQKRIPIDIDLVDGSHLWLDNQHLVFTRVQGENGPQGYPMVVISPFTDKHVKLASNYPSFQLSPSGPPGTMAFTQSDVVYDPSLNLVIFPFAIEGSYIVLWDRQSQSVLAKVNGAIGYYPLWSPDVSQFLVPLLSPKQSGNPVVEWFVVSRGGRVEQFTHFGDYFQTSEIGNGYNWSPDGQKLAFWLDISPSLCSGLNLALLDIVTKQVTDTCIPNLADVALPPIWSLDSRYVVVTNASAKSRHLIIVDTVEGRAFDITNMAQGAQPIGWLVSP